MGREEYIKHCFTWKIGQLIFHHNFARSQMLPPISRKFICSFAPFKGLPCQNNTHADFSVNFNQISYINRQNKGQGGNLTYTFLHLTHDAVGLFFPIGWCRQMQLKTNWNSFAGFQFKLEFKITLFCDYKGINKWPQSKSVQLSQHALEVVNTTSVSSAEDAPPFPRGSSNSWSGKNWRNRIQVPKARRTKPTATPLHSTVKLC